MSFVKYAACAAAFCAVVAASDANAGVIVSPVGAVVDSGGTATGLTIDDTINQRGLLTPFVSGVTDFSTYLATNPLHDPIMSHGEWVSGLLSGLTPTKTQAVVTYDMGSVMHLNAIALWNEDAFGVGAFDIYSSLDDLTFNLVASGVMPPNKAFTPPTLTSYGAFVFGNPDGNSILARYVRLDLRGCPQPDGPTITTMTGEIVPVPRCGIGEVAFSEGTAVPEPSSIALLSAGLLGLAAFTRRKRKSQEQS